MDALYSPSTQTLALIPRFSSSSSSSSSSFCLGASKIQTIRSEFLGSGTELRLRLRRKCKRIRFRATAPVPVAALSALPIVVVVAVTISAAALAFTNLHRKKSSDDDKVPDPPLSSGNELDSRNTGEHLHTESPKNSYSSTEAVQSTTEINGTTLELPSHDHSATVEDTSGVENVEIPVSYVDGILSVPQLSSDTDSQEPLPSLTVESEAPGHSELLPVADPEASPELDETLVFATQTSDATVLSEDSEVVTESIPQSSSDLEALALLRLLLKGSNLVNQETDFNTSPSTDVVEVSDAMSEVLKIEITKDNDLEVPPNEHDESESSHYGSTEPAREDLYSFYENMLAFNNSELQSVLATETQEPGAYLVGDTFQARKEFWKNRRSQKSDTQDITFREDEQASHDVSDVLTMQVNGKDSSCADTIAYNKLLRKGRLNECIELLEEMDRKDILDMSKVYHAKFFNICRGQKAVKEAFSFVKLIPNPTLSTFNMLMSVCSAAQDSEGAFEVMRLVQKAGIKADCKLYTTLISACAKSGKVDTMFEVFHEMVNSGEEPNVHTYGALIDGCARAGQVAKAFGAYGILRSKNVKPDRVVFNALITACGQSGAVERAFDVLAEMGAELHPIDPDHITIGALIRACTITGQADRVKGVYKMIDKYNIKGTPELYTIAVNSCSQTGDWEFACDVYADMKKNGVIPDEMFFSALIHVAGDAGNLDAAFEVLHDARSQGLNPGIISYSSLMGACSNTRSWQRALELFEQIKAMKLYPTVSTVNALITALCDAGQIKKAMDVLSEMKELGLCPNDVTYSILIAASERNDDIDAGLALFYQAKADAVPFSQMMCKCLIKMCYRRFEKASTIGEPVLSFKSGRPQIDSKWSSLALTIYRDIIGAGLIPSSDMLSQVLGCLQLPQDVALKKRLIEALEISAEASRNANLLPLIDGFAEYDLRAFSLFEEAASLGIVPFVSFKESPIVIDVRDFSSHIAKVYVLTVLKGFKHRLAAGARLPSITISLSVDTAEISSPAGEKTINVSGRVSQTVGALLRRLRLPYQGNESLGKIKITGLAAKRWLQPKLVSSLDDEPAQLGLFQLGLTSGISNQQRTIRTGSLSFD